MRINIYDRDVVINMFSYPISNARAPFADSHATGCAGVRYFFRPGPALHPKEAEPGREGAR